MLNEIIPNRRFIPKKSPVGPWFFSCLSFVGREQAHVASAEVALFETPDPSLAEGWRGLR